MVGAQALARSIGLENVITFDMGGTTAKAAIIERGALSRTLEYQVGGGIMTGSRLLTGAGYLLKVPAIDLAEVGAGGGSIVRIDAGGALTVGPESAGAAPGPVCYATGGTEPTITDANVILGYLNPAYLVGGGLRLDADLRPRRVRGQGRAAARSRRSSTPPTARHRIAAANMIRAIRAVSIERGRDPRDYALCAFGGNGPVFACAMARELGMRQIVVPPAPGLFSAFGLLYADVEHHYGRTFRRLLRELDLGALSGAWDQLVDQARDQLDAEGFAPERMRIQRQASLHYQGQTFDLTVAVPVGVLDRAALAPARGGVRPGARAHLRPSRRARGAGRADRDPRDRPRHPGTPAHAAGARPRGRRSRRPLAATARLLRPGDRLARHPGSPRSALATPHDGPCIVEEYDATCVIPPGARASLDAAGNILIRL